MTALQAFPLAVASGVNPDALLAVMTRHGNLTPTLKGVTAGEASSGREAFLECQAGIGENDLSLAIEFAEAVGVAVPVAAAVRAGMRAALTGKKQNRSYCQRAVFWVKRSWSCRSAGANWR